MALPEDVKSLVTWVAEGVGLISPPTDAAAPFAGATSMVLAEDEDVVLVDAGLPPAIRRKLAPHVDVCILTHCHVPHMRGARDFREIWAPHDEARALESPEDFLSTYEVERRDSDIVSSGIRKAGYSTAPVAKRLRPDSILKLARSEWQLMRVPGHSQGLTLLLDSKRHILFSSDLDAEHPPWYGYPTSDPSEFERTATMLVDVPVALLLSSHGKPKTRGIKPMFRQMAETIRQRDRLVLNAITAPHTLDELTDLGLLGGKPTTSLGRYHERIMVEKHLARLLEHDHATARQDGRFHRA